jgi:hypothetical protein
MTVIFDELIEENFTSLGNGVLRLDGAREFRKAFADAKRADGSAVQPNDQFPVTAVASPSIMTTAIGVYTPGAPATLDISSGPFYQSSAVGGGLPDFGAKTGIVGNVLPAPLFLFKNLSGLIENPEAIRQSLLTATMKTFKDSAILVANEAVAAQSGGNTASFAEDFLGGLVAAVTGEADPADEEDIFATATGGIKGLRRSVKAWRTYRNRPVLAGGFVTVLTASADNGLYGVHVQDRATKANYCAGCFRGDAANVVPVDVIEATAALRFDTVGNTVRAWNTTGAQIDIDYTPGRIA